MGVVKGLADKWVVNVPWRTERWQRRSTAHIIFLIARMKYVVATQQVIIRPEKAESIDID